MSRHVRYEVDDGIATVTLARPDRRNAVTNSMVFAVMDHLDEAGADPAVRAVVLTGEGPAFCVGADVSRGGAAFGEAFDTTAAKAGTTVDGAGSPRPFREPGGLLAERILACHRPVIAAVNGDAAGMGATILCAADARVAAETARFGFVFTRRGLTLEAGSSWFLPRLVGMPTALDWAMSGRLVPAAEACEAGFVRSVHPSEELAGAARAVCDRFTDGTSPASMVMTRHLLWAGTALATPTEAHVIESRLVAHRAKSPDGVEGIEAFVQRRPPRFDPIVEGQVPDWLPRPWLDEAPPG